MPRGSRARIAPTRDKQMAANVAAMVGIGPNDVLEGKMAAQLLAAHNAAMECYRRAMLGEQSFEARRENLSHAMSDPLRALHRVFSRRLRKEKPELLPAKARSG